MRHGSHEALAGVDLTIAGGLTALLGPNGAGKTTLVECLVGLRQPDEGVLRVLDHDPTDTWLRSRVGVMLQDGGLPLAAPAGQVLRHLAAMYADPADIAELSDRLGLTTFARTPVRRLSGGERQRLALAAALVGRPTVLLLDEPTAGLDPHGRLVVRELIGELCEAGTTILLTTHITAEAATLADQVVILDAGRVRAAGSPNDLVGVEHGLRLRIDQDAAALRADLETTLRVPVIASASLLEIRADPTPALVHRITGWAVDRRIRIIEMAAGQRTLEEVVLALTGRSLR